MKLRRFLRRTIAVVLHVVLFVASLYLAFVLRFDGQIPRLEHELLLKALPLVVAIRLVTFQRFRLYQGLWLYTSITDLVNLIVASILGTIGSGLVISAWSAFDGYPRSTYAIDTLLVITLCGGIRLTRRIVSEFQSPATGKRVLIFGAGDMGEMVVRSLPRGTSMNPIGFLDDDPHKLGRRIHGVPVLGTLQDLPRVAAEKKADEMLIALPRAEAMAVRDAINNLKGLKLLVKCLPELEEILERQALEGRGLFPLPSQIEPEIEDLLARPSNKFDTEPLRRLVAGRCVLVTGAAGSIGSELCRQVLAFRPRMLVLYDRHENGVYRLEKDLIKYNQYCQIVPVVGDVTDPARVDAMMATYRPDYIFHAAAHKHVPLMEANICEAVKNNVTGTRTIAETAQRYRASGFILVSTDKAVKPTSVMGATKRVAEFLVLSMGARGSKCHFTAVRFGNVLGSNGSVVPRFIEQIRSGGPVTVTHPEMSRFFMSIREAVQLLLFSATLDDLDALYILEMGEPVKIVDMARHLIRLLGLEPDKDIQIEFTGSRPGEKLHEELLEAEENAERSTVRNILKVVGPLPEPAQLARSIVCLETLSALGDADMVTRALSDLVPSFRPPVELPAPGAK